MTDDPRDDETQILARMSDAVEAGALRDLLETEGIAVSTPGLTHRSMLGIAGGYVDIIVRVPKKDLERAREIYDGLRTASPPIDERPEDRPRTDRNRRVAVFAALWLPVGGGSFYARRTRVGLAFLALQAACVGLALAWPPFWYGVLGVPIVDAISSVLWIGSLQHGRPAPIVARVGPALAAAMIALVPLSLVAAPSLYAGRAMVAACAKAAECGGPAQAACVAQAAQVAFEGRGSTAREADCAQCLEQVTCDQSYAQCGLCRGLVELPLPREDVLHGPVGTTPDDLQRVVPDIFGRHGSDGAPEHDLDEMLRAIEDTPPPAR